jgi:hypothetical protein
MKKTFHEIFTEVEKKRTKNEKIEVLKANSSAAMKAILGYTYDPNVKWLLPDGVPPYKPVAEGIEADGRLYSETKKLYLFVDGPSDTQRNLKQARREQLFIELLETVDPGDAKVLIGMKDGKLPYRGMTRKLVADAFPNIAKNW